MDLPPPHVLATSARPPRLRRSSPKVGRPRHPRVRRRPHQRLHRRGLHQQRPRHLPLISYFTVHLPTLLPDGSATSLTLLPRLVRTDGDLALFRVMIGSSYIDPDHNNYIIYRAGVNKLEVLPTHPTRLFADWDGSIKYSEVWAHPVPGSPNRATYIFEDWGAAILTWLEPKKKWHIDLKLKASDIIMDETHSQLLPQHDVKATTKNATLSRLHTGHPALSLHDDDVVYIMAKVDHMDDDSWMLAVDMRNKTLKGVAALTSRFMYLQSDLSSHLVPTSENTEVFNLPPKGKRSSRRKKRNAAKTGKQEAGKTLANSCRVDADAIRGEQKHLLQVAEQEEQELTILEPRVISVR
ncbi:hypothetical protein VPH35_091765 [Triticum aestivum]